MILDETQMKSNMTLQKPAIMTLMTILVFLLSAVTALPGDSFENRNRAHPAQEKSTDGDSSDIPSEPSPLSTPDGESCNVPPGKIIWKDKEQQFICESYIEKIRAAFFKTRYSCMRPDLCRCSEDANLFLELANQCEIQCPENFLEKNGYSKRLRQNVIWLKDSRSQDCPNSDVP
jgi:hypothetical protein